MMYQHCLLLKWISISLYEYFFVQMTRSSVSYCKPFLYYVHVCCTFVHTGGKTRHHADLLATTNTSS